MGKCGEKNISIMSFKEKELKETGNDYSSSFVATPGRPGPPGVIRVEEIGDTWVKLLWTKGAEHNSPILFYTIQTRHFWALNEDDWRNASTCKYYTQPQEGTLTLLLPVW